MGLKFTVVTVVFNAEHVLRKTLESVLQQTYLPYEYLLFDGKSTDNTLQIAQEYTEAFARKGVSYRIVSERDTGIYDAMNKGVATATGDFISFLNAGDWYEQDALENIDALYQEKKFELTYGGLHYIKPDGYVIDKMSRLDRFLVSSRNWNHPSMFLKREVYQNYYFDEQFKFYADFNLYLALRKAGVKIAVIDKVITNFVADGISTNPNIKLVLARSKEKYNIYRNNNYARYYWLESYGWELLKIAYLSIARRPKAAVTKAVSAQETANV